MNVLFQFVFMMLIFALDMIPCQAKEQLKRESRPNIILIVADDLGYGELGCYGQKKIETPNIDKLAKEGMKFSQFYSGSSVCAPSRCVLLTGKHTGHADIRENDSWRSRGDVHNIFEMLKDPSLEGNLPMQDTTITIARLLQKEGYRTGMSGKWGLGAPHTKSLTNKKGFDFFIGYNCQRIAHTYYPPFLYKNSKRVFLRNEAMALSQRLPEAKDPMEEKSYSPYTQIDYAPDVMYIEMEKYIVGNKKYLFFFYWASIIPHVALQAPKRWVDYYVEKFGDEKPYTGDNGYYPHRYPHAAYAAMISYLDENIGKLVLKLKQLGLYDNPLIIFTSDNGPSFNGGTDPQWFQSASILGSQKNKIKGSLDDGGIRVPMIASWKGSITPGSESNHIFAFWDILPTLCEVAGARIPDDIDGISMLPTFLAHDGQEEHTSLYWELRGNQAVRKGKWKGVRTCKKGKACKLRLYNLEKDIQEDNDIAQDYPEIVKQIEATMQNKHTPPAFK